MEQWHARQVTTGQFELPVRILRPPTLAALVNRLRDRNAERLGALLNDWGVPFVALDACRTATADERLAAGESVGSSLDAARLAVLAEGKSV